MQLARRAVELLREEGVGEFVDRASAWYRRTVPGPLSPVYPYLLHYDNAEIERVADEVYTVQEPQTARIEYDGAYDDRLPPMFDERDWETTNTGRTVFQFRDGTVIGAPAGVGHRPSPYRPPQAGTPATVRVGRRFVVPSAVGTKTRRRDRSVQHLDRVLRTRGVVEHALLGVGPDREFESAFLLPSPYGQGYAAWQSDLFKLRALERYERRTGTEPQLVVTPGPSELVRTYLSLMGYPPERYVTLGDETVRAERLLVPSHRPRKGSGELQPSPSDRPWARDRILSTLGLTDETAAERLYVSRQDEHRRRVVNFDDVWPVLEEYGFREYNPGNHPLEDQIRTFAAAEAVVGPHSSGMINCMFASEATVVELLSTDHWRASTVFVVANEMGFEYEICPCEPVPESHSVVRHQDVVVDPDTLERVLERTLAHADAGEPLA